MPKKGYKKPVRGDASDPEGMLVWARRYVEHMRVRGYAERTLVTTEGYLGLFIEWADDRGLSRPAEVTKAMLEAYQRYLFYYRKPSGKPLSYASQRVRLQKVRGWFRYLTRNNLLDANPASELELPRVERRLPRAVLTEREVEKVLAIADLTELSGVRDRAMMEVLYSTGIRRAELAALSLFDIDADRGTLSVRLGKGRKDRVVPIGERALRWVRRYLDEARPLYVVTPDEGTLFVDERGVRFELARLTQLMKRYIERAKLGKTGACHIFRHTMATLMLEGGADVRHIQEILGHVDMSTTQIYTRISIRHLKNVHDATHPGAKRQGRLPLGALGQSAPAPTRDELLAALDGESGQEDGGEDG